MRALPFAIVVSLVVLAFARPAAGAEPGWDRARIRKDLEANKPLVVHVVVALCSNEQIDCGSRIAGRAGELDHNVYWGAIFGARRFLERKRSEFSRVWVGKIDDVVLQRAVYRRRVPATRWKLQRKGSVEEIVVLDAVHGDSIDRAVSGFFKAASSGETLSIVDSGHVRTLRVQVAGYVGHNRLMDGVTLPAAKPSRDAVPSFVLACYSESYFGDSLRRAGSTPLVTTRQLMAPEGYVLDAVLRGVGDGLDRKAIRARAVAAYAKWQKLSHGVASSIFAGR